MSGVFRRFPMNLVCVSGRSWPWRVSAMLLLAICALPTAMAQQRREREPNSVYAERRAKLASNIDGPVVLLGYTGREEEAQAYIFAQDENFYYLTGHNEEEAALILLPPNGSRAKKGDWEGPREIFFLPAKNPSKEKWNGVRMSPAIRESRRARALRWLKSCRNCAPRWNASPKFTLRSTPFFPTSVNWAAILTRRKSWTG